MRSDILHDGGRGYQRVSHFHSSECLFEVVFVPMERDGEVAAATTIRSDANPFAIASDLVLAAAHVDGLPPTLRVRLLSEASLLVAAGLRDMGQENGSQPKTGREPGDEEDFGINPF